MTLTFCDEASRKRTRTTSAGLVIRGMIYVFRPEEAERRPLRLPASRRTACATRRLSDAIRGEGMLKKTASNAGWTCGGAGGPAPPPNASRARPPTIISMHNSSTCGRQRGRRRPQGGAERRARTGNMPEEERHRKSADCLPTKHCAGIAAPAQARQATHSRVRSRGCDNGG